jgi:hypothetical protein
MIHGYVYCSPTCCSVLRARISSFDTAQDREPVERRSVKRRTERVFLYRVLLFARYEIRFTSNAIPRDFVNKAG